MSSVLEIKRELEEQVRLTKELNEELEHALEITTKNPNVLDGVQLASELGRLDFISIVLGIIAILLAVLAFCGFWMIKSAALDAAREAARDEINAKAPEMFVEASKLTGEDGQKAMVNFSEVDSDSIIGEAIEVKRD